MEYVYWIHRKDHTDPYTEGYIGISNNPASRFSSHRRAKVNPHLRKAMELYDDIVFDIIHEFNTREEARLMEEHYRPEAGIGYNINKGGDDPPREHLQQEEIKRKISDTHKKRGTNPYSTNTHSPEAISKRRESMKGRRWFYDPVTGKSSCCRQQPEGWLPGKKHIEPTSPPKIRGVDYVAHVSSWLVEDPNGNKYEVTNLKKWCSQMDVPYQRVVQGHKGWKAIKR